jgi:hypothetical protein
MAQKHLNNRELAAFRRDVSALKKAGVIPASTKVRGALPSTIQNGKMLREYVKKYKAATPSGGNIAQIIKVPKTIAKQYRKLDYTTDATRGSPGTHVMVPVPSKNGKVTIDKDGGIHVPTPGGIEIVHLPVQYHNLTQYLQDVQKDSRHINRMKSANELFGFQYYGNNSIEAFPNIQSLLSHLTAYHSLEPLLRKSHSKDAREMIQNLVIVKGDDISMYKFTGSDRKSKLQRGIRINKSGGKLSKSQKRKLMPEWKLEQYRTKRRKEEQKRRDKKKGK